jgi:hypothetical protein
MRETPALTDMIFSLSYMEREDALREVTEAEDIFSVRTRPSPVRIAEIKTNVAAALIFRTAPQFWSLNSAAPSPDALH